MTKTWRSTDRKEAEGRGPGAAPLRRAWGHGPGLGVCLSLIRGGTHPLDAQQEEPTGEGFESDEKTTRFRI